MSCFPHFDVFGICRGSKAKMSSMLILSTHVGNPQYKLDPTYEPERNGNEPKHTPPPDPDNTAVFAILQELNRVNLLIPKGAPHMYHAAMHSKSCTLTALGEHYRRLIENDMI